MKHVNTLIRTNWRIILTVTRQYKVEPKIISNNEPPVDPNENLIPEDTKNNWIGPPHPISNLRTIKFYVAENESSVERNYRLKRIEVQKWNQEFWEEHNSNFVKRKEEFIKKYQKKMMKKNQSNPPSTEEMSVFFKQFLDDNYSMHVKYNWEWYKRNIGLLWPALQVFFFHLKKKSKVLILK